MRKGVFVAGLMALAVMGCSKYETLEFPKVPPELADCKFFKLTDESGSSLKVARCPNSTTTSTYSQGKTSATTVVTEPAGLPLRPTAAPTPSQVNQSPRVDEPPVSVNYHGRTYIRQD